MKTDQRSSVDIDKINLIVQTEYPLNFGQHNVLTVKLNQTSHFYFLRSRGFISIHSSVGKILHRLLAEKLYGYVQLKLFKP